MEASEASPRSTPGVHEFRTQIPVARAGRVVINCGLVCKSQSASLKYAYVARECVFMSVDAP